MKKDSIETSSTGKGILYQIVRNGARRRDLPFRVERSNAQGYGFDIIAVTATKWGAKREIKKDKRKRSKSSIVYREEA